MPSRSIAVGLGALLLAGCAAQASEPSPRNPLHCGVALIVEREIARGNRYDTLVERLGPVIQWYTFQGAMLPEGRRSEGEAHALMVRFRNEVTLRKNVAKACVTAAYGEPEFRAALPRLTGAPAP